jgi:hypothetical protein
MKELDVNFKDFNQLDESIITILNSLLGDQNAPLTAGEMIIALHKAKIDKQPETIKKSIKMLDTLIDYVTTLSKGKSKSTIDGIEKIKKTMTDALREIEG